MHLTTRRKLIFSYFLSFVCLGLLCALIHFGFLFAAESELSTKMKEGLAIGLIFGMLISLPCAMAVHLNANCSVDNVVNVSVIGLKCGLLYGAVILVLDIITFGWIVALVSGVVGGMMVGLSTALMLGVLQESKARGNPES